MYEELSRRASPPDSGISPAPRSSFERATGNENISEIWTPRFLYKNMNNLCSFRRISRMACTRFLLSILKTVLRYFSHYRNYSIGKVGSKLPYRELHCRRPLLLLRAASIRVSQSLTLFGLASSIRTFPERPSELALDSTRCGREKRGDKMNRNNIYCTDFILMAVKLWYCNILMNLWE